MVQQPEDDDLLIVERFFSLKELVAERIPKTVSKTPDFTIKRGAEVVAFCEVKSPQDVFQERLRSAILQAPEGQFGGVCETGPISRPYRCMERAAKKAVAQFNSGNPLHAYPNILLIVNHDTLARRADFVEAVTGYIEELGEYAATSLRKEIPEIDAYVWLNAATPETRIFWRHNEFRDTIIELLKPD
jgi:hypothetical protein